MASLLELSHELLHCIFTEIELADLSALAQTCRVLNSYIRSNRLLHKDLYTGRYDEPTTCEEEPDYEDLLHRAVRLEKLFDTEDVEAKRRHLHFVAQEIPRLVERADLQQDKSKNMQWLEDAFRNPDNVDSFLCASSLFAPGRAGGNDQMAAGTEELRQASAKLHCLYGTTVCTRSHSAGRTTHTYARSKVYDLREYTDATRWGPFMKDGSQRVDWEKVEAIMIVLGFNLRKFTDRSDGRFPIVWRDPWVGATPGSYKSAPRIGDPSNHLEEEEGDYKIRELALSLDAMDPYGVTGSWMRVVCFLDYNDLYAFNFSERIPDSQPREPIDTEEAIRLIRIKLQVTRIEAPGTRNDEDETEDDGDWRSFQGERLPIVHFRGTSRSLHASWDPNANSRIRGSVRQTPEGEIRWTTFSIFHGEERWRSEGIQVGGLKSARGVLGNWFDKDYDMHGPAGPTAFWKESDELDE
ncbi:uncharacterized protein MYCFIDRAFT_98456, partial [Pseudocercospora fijiensis CIRAD86]